MSDRAATRRQTRPRERAKASELWESIEQHLRALELDGARPRTVETYAWSLQQLALVHRRGGPATVTAGELADLFAGFPAASRRHRVAAYRGYFAWCVREGLIERNPVERLPRARQRARTSLIEVFTEAEQQRLTGLPGIDGLLLSVMLDAGLRKGECRHLACRHTDHHEGIVVVIDGKGGKDRLIPMTRRLVQQVGRYRTELDMADDDYWWYSRPAGWHVRRDRPISESRFAVWWREQLEAADVRYRNPHTTRHTFATRWIRNGGRLETLSRAMGHGSIRTTFDLYGHLDLSDIRHDLYLIEGGQSTDETSYCC